MVAILRSCCHSSLVARSLSCLSLLGVIFSTGGEEWKLVADRLGFDDAYIRCFDYRFRNPFETVLSCCNLTVGQLYDVLVECGFPVFADFL